MDDVEDPGFALPPARKFSRAEYRDLVRAGVLADNERVELLFGRIVAMSPVDPSHVWTAKRIYDALMIALRDRAVVFQQSPFAASGESEPEPDVMIAPLGCSPRDRDHASRLHLAIEVSRTSLSLDRGVKATLYARAEVDEYWVIDLVHGLVEVRRDPDRARGSWASLTTYQRGTRISPLAFPEITLAVDDILGPAAPATD